LKAYETKIFEGPLQGCVNKYAFVGFNRTGNPIEIFYNPIGVDAIKVFHAMKCRDGVIAQFQP
jgi:hypothetical protein